MTGSATRLYPLPTFEIPTESIYEDLDLPAARSRDPSLPYVTINMVTTVDGKTAVGGKASPLSSRVDRQTMRNLRTGADAVMIGANTLRAERLSLGLDEPSQRPQPMAVIITTSDDVPLRNLVQLEGQRVLVITTREAQSRPEDPSGESAHVLRIPATPTGSVDLPAALRVLKDEHSVELLLVEGGPKLNHALVSADLADELFLTVVPRLIGGSPHEAPPILSGLELQARSARLRSVYLCDNDLFLRYDLRPSP